jgi:hypothetical protein
MWSVSGGIPNERKTVDTPKQLTVTMFYIIITQVIKLRIPKYLFAFGPVLGIESKPNFFELLNSFRIQFAIFEACTLSLDPNAQCRVFLVLLWNIA